MESHIGSTKIKNWRRVTRIVSSFSFLSSSFVLQSLQSHRLFSLMHAVSSFSMSSFACLWLQLLVLRCCSWSSCFGLTISLLHHFSLLLPLHQSSSLIFFVVVSISSCSQRLFDSLVPVSCMPSSSDTCLRQIVISCSVTRAVWQQARLIANPLGIRLNIS